VGIWHFGVAMDPTIIASAIVTVLGAVAGIITAVHVSRNKAAEVALGCWKELADALQKRLTEVEKQLAVERDKNNRLEIKIAVLESERMQLRDELTKAQCRIDELEDAK
jgi:chromosome segregation ATPase